MPSVSFIRSMVARFPTLDALLKEHIEDFEEILPHLFFGDVTRHIVSLLPAASGSDFPRRRELRDILAHLEESYSRGDDELQELISVSFLENLPRPGEAGAQIREMVGPTLRAQLAVIG